MNFRRVSEYKEECNTITNCNNECKWQIHIALFKTKQIQ